MKSLDLEHIRLIAVGLVSPANTIVINTSNNAYHIITCQTGLHY